MTQITGLDLSLTATGIARLIVTGGSTPDTHPRHVLDTTTVKSSGTLKDTYAQRAQRLQDLRDNILDQTTPTDLVVIEGPSYGSTGGSTWDRAGLFWQVTLRLHRLVPTVILPPNTLKKYATGIGSATKADMRVELWKRTKQDIRDDNQVDATWLAIAGAHWLGHPIVTLPAANVAALDKAEWPTQT